MKNPVILFNEKKFCIYFFLCDFDNLKLGKLLSVLSSYYECSVNIFNYT